MLSGTRSWPFSGCIAASKTLSTGASMFADVMATSHVSPVLTTLEVAISFAGGHVGSVLPPHPASSSAPITIASVVRMGAV
jgi:hypothetical protein